MQKYFIFGLMAMLAACSSDSGGGLNDGYMQYIPGGFATGVKTTSQAERDKYLAGKIDGDRNQNTNKAAFDNMYSVLLGNGADTADVSELLQAIKVAGMNYNGTETDPDSIRNWIQEHQTELQTAAREVYMKYGLFLTDIDFKVSNTDVSNTPMHFTLNGTTISGINFGDPNVTYVGTNGLFRGKDNKGISATPGIDSGNLKYSNFGRIAYGDIIPSETNKRDGKIDLETAKYATYYGGYENLKVSKPSDGKFTGGIIGVVYGRDGTALRTGGNATLDAKTGTLSAQFSDWYSVKYDGTNITFSNADGRADIKNNYKFNETDGVYTATGANMTTQFYGEKGVAEEVVGSLSYEDASDSKIRLDAAFGGAKEKAK